MFLQDLKYSFRRLLKTPGFTFVVVLTMALGIGANSAIFTVINAVLLRPLPYADPSRLVLLTERGDKFPQLSATYPNFVDWRNQSQSFQQFGAVRTTSMTIMGASEPDRVIGQMVTANVFDMLGTNMAVGRSFVADDERSGAPNVAIISYGLSVRRFNTAQSAMGETLRVDTKPFTIVGVLPRGFQLMQQTPDVLLAFEPWAKTLPPDRSWHPGIFPIARLKSDVTLEQARAEMSTIAKRVLAQNPNDDMAVDINVKPMQLQLVENLRPALLVIAAAVAFVLLLACVNTANLMLARTATLQREIAVRLAIGSSRWRIVRLLMMESLLLALLGAVCGLALAFISVPALLHLGGNSLPASANIGLDWKVLAFTTAASVLCGLIFGLAPALHVGLLNLRSALSESDRGAVGVRAARFRRGLVIGEVAVALPLLIAAGLFLRAFNRLSVVEPGFVPDHLLIADLPVAPAAHPQPTERLAMFEQILDGSAALPGVKTVGATSAPPVTGNGSILHFNIQGRPPHTPQEYIFAGYRTVSAGYLKTLQASLLQGRWISDADRENTPPVVVINAAMAHSFFPNVSPLGKHLQIGTTPDDKEPWMEVVGVISDTKQSLASDSAAEMYLPFRQAERILPVLSLSYLLRTSGDPNAVANAFRAVVHDIDPNQPVVKIRTMEENIASSISEPRFRTVLLSLFAALALGMTAIGIYGVMAYSVAQRTRELGVRLALGSSPGEIFQLVVRQAVVLTLIGVAVGLCLSTALSRYLSTLLFQIRTFDALTLTATPAMLVVVGALAAYIPARRATRVDPLAALRAE